MINGPLVSFDPEEDTNSAPHADTAAAQLAGLSLSTPPARGNALTASAPARAQGTVPFVTPYQPVQIPLPANFNTPNVSPYPLGFGRPLQSPQPPMPAPPPAPPIGASNSLPLRRSQGQLNFEAVGNLSPAVAMQPPLPFDLTASQPARTPAPANRTPPSPIAPQRPPSNPYPAPPGNTAQTPTTTTATSTAPFRTILIPGLYNDPSTQVVVVDGVSLVFNEESKLHHLENFYEDVFLELTRYGPIEELVVSDTLAADSPSTLDDVVFSPPTPGRRSRANAGGGVAAIGTGHIRRDSHKDNTASSTGGGHVYCRYATAAAAAAAVAGLRGRSYAGRPLADAVPCMLTSFKDAICAEYDASLKCTRGGYCTRLHIKRPSVFLLAKLFEYHRLSMTAAGRVRLRRTVYVRRLGIEVSQERLEKFFENAVGRVVACRLMGQDAHGARFALVEFATDEAVAVALNEVDYSVLSTRGADGPVTVHSLADIGRRSAAAAERWSADAAGALLTSTSGAAVLHFSGLPIGITREQLIEFVRSTVAQHAGELLVDDGVDTSTPGDLVRGAELDQEHQTAFVEFRDPETAQRALMMNGMKFHGNSICVAAIRSTADPLGTPPAALGNSPNGSHGDLLSLDTGERAAVPADSGTINLVELGNYVSTSTAPARTSPPLPATQPAQPRPPFVEEPLITFDAPLVQLAANPAIGYPLATAANNAHLAQPALPPRVDPTAYVGHVMASPRRDHAAPIGPQAVTPRGGISLVDSTSFAAAEINYEDLELLEKVGEGAYGTVFKAKWLGKIVAVKKFHRNVSAGGGGDWLEKFRKEVSILGKLRHPNILLMIGACTLSLDNLCIVTEFLVGNVWDLLHNSQSPLKYTMLHQIAKDTALGVNYLHSCNPVIVHRDLKSPNLLFDQAGTVKVCDFGLSRIKQEGTMTGRIGTPAWTAPEVLLNKHYSEKADVYSFGIVLYELFTRQVPFANMDPIQIAMAVINEKKRPIIPPTVPPPIAKLMVECWSEEPDDRPTFRQIVQRLHEISFE